MPRLSWVWKEGISVLAKSDAYAIDDGRKGKLSRKTFSGLGGAARAEPCVKLEWNERIG